MRYLIFFLFAISNQINGACTAQQVLPAAQINISQLNVDLHPYNEFPGWVEQFSIQYEKPWNELGDEDFYLRRRELQVVDQPKSYTQLITGP